MAEREIKVNIGGDTSDLDRALTKGQANLLRFAKIGAAAVAAVGVAMIGLTKQSLANIDALAKQARSLGLTTSALQKMAMVAGEAGVEAGQLSSMLGLMQRNIIELQKGTKTQTDSFAKMGLSIKDLQGLSPDEQFRLIAEGLNGITDPAAKTAAAMDVFGRSGRAAINMMQDYSAKADEAAKFQREWGITVSQFDSDRIEAANDAFGRIGLALTGIGNTMAATVAPAIIALSEGLLRVTGEGSNFRAVIGFISENLDVMANSVGVLAVGLTAKAIPAIYSMVTATGFLTGAMVALRSAVFLTGIGALVIGAGYLITKFVDLTEKVGGVGNALGLLKGVAIEVYDRLRRGVSLVGESFAAAGMAMKAAFFEAFAAIAQKFATFTQFIADGLNSVLGTQLQGVGVDFANRLSDSAANLSSASSEFGKSMATSFGDLAAPLTSLDALSSAMNAPGSTTGTSLTSGAGGLLPPALGGAGETEGGIGGGGGAGGLKGGAGIASDMATRLEALQEGLMTEREVVAAWYEESKMTLVEALEAELLTRAEYNDAIQRLEAEHQDRMGNIKEAGGKRGLKAALDGGAAILGAMGAVNKKALKASQIYAAAEALVSTYKGAAKEMEKGVLGYATAAAVIAKGIGFVAAIKGVSASGGSVGGGGGGSSAAAAAPAPAQAPATTFAFTLQNDPMGFGEGFARQLIEQLNATQRNGGQIRGVLA